MIEVTSFDKGFVAVLGAVVDAGRAALRELDADEVPAKLKRVARSTGKGLPSPLAVSLLAEIDSSEWFRGKVGEAHEASRRVDAVAEAFLRRDEGWWVVVAEAVAAAGRADAELGVAKANADSQAARKKLDAARARERALRRRAEELEADHAAVVEDKMRPVRTAADRERRRADEAAARLAAATIALSEASEVIADLEERQRLLYERLQRARSERAELERRLGSGERSAIPPDAIGIGRWLDDAARSLAPYRAGAGEPPSSESEPAGDMQPLRLPPGVRPDTRDAIDALSELRPGWVLVDGHNVLGAIDRRSIGDPEARRKLVDGLGAMARALPGTAIVVVFDSALGGQRESIAFDTGITVRFSPPTSAADDVLTEEAEELGTGSVVISNDREVRERTARAGALALWADALVAWLSAPRRPGATQ